MVFLFILITYMDLSEGPAVKLTSEEEPNRQDGFERNPPSVFKCLILNHKLSVSHCLIV